MSRAKQYANRVNILKYIKSGDNWRFAAVVEIKGKVVRDHVWIAGQNDPKVPITSSGVNTESVTAKPSLISRTLSKQRGSKPSKLSPSNWPFIH